MNERERTLYVTLITVLTAFIVAGVVIGGSGVGAATLRLQIAPARLIHDYTESAGVGAAMINAALVAGIGLVLVAINGISLSGPTVAAVFTMLGFGLFGKSVFNVVPILFGVFLAAKLGGKRFGEYILIGLFGTALGPVVTTVAFEVGVVTGEVTPSVAWIIGAIGAGTITGFLIPPVAIAMLRLHQGYSLYNIGLTSGFIALFAAALLRAGGTPLSGIGIWNSGNDPVSAAIIPVVSFICLLSGVLTARKNALRDLARIMKLSGRLPSDFVDIVSSGGALVNMGIMGLLSWGYIVAVGAPHNGPTIGAACTVIGFAAFGKHPRNTWPVVAGVTIGAIVFGFSLSSPGPILAALFVTTLAPLAGDFGALIGLVAGFIHFTLVMQSGAWHGGIALYNNGFAGGFTATLLLAIIEWYRSTHDETMRRWRRDSK